MRKTIAVIILASCGIAISHARAHADDFDWMLNDMHQQFQEMDQRRFMQQQQEQHDELMDEMRREHEDDMTQRQNEQMQRQLDESTRELNCTLYNMCQQH